MALTVVISVAFESRGKNPDGNKLRKPVRGERGSEAAGRQGVGVGYGAGERGSARRLRAAAGWGRMAQNTAAVSSLQM